jgi:hypothetical protein
MASTAEKIVGGKIKYLQLITMPTSLQSKKDPTQRADF